MDGCSDPYTVSLAYATAARVSPSFAALGYTESKQMADHSMGHVSEQEEGDQEGGFCRGPCDTKSAAV
jgi:hypothetical protein